jgi:hypothetical protein
LKSENKRENGRTGETENGRNGERENGRTGEREKGRKGEREKGRRGERETGRRRGEKGERGKGERSRSRSPSYHFFLPSRFGRTRDRPDPPDYLDQSNKRAPGFLASLGMTISFPFSRSPVLLFSRSPQFPPLEPPGFTA